MAGKVLLHVGSPKTGTTSIQKYLVDREGPLLEAGVRVGKLAWCSNANNGVLNIVCARSETGTPAKYAFVTNQGWAALDGLRERVRRELDALLSAPCRVLALSNEGLFFLRHHDEYERLRAMLRGVPAEVLLYLRSPGAYLRSLAIQFDALPDISEADALGLFREELWLIDYEAKTAMLRDVFGAENVTVLSYEEALAADGSVLPSFLGRLGVTVQPVGELGGYVCNRSTEKDGAGFDSARVRGMFHLIPQ